MTIATAIAALAALADRRAATNSAARKAAEIAFRAASESLSSREIAAVYAADDRAGEDAVREAYRVLGRAGSEMRDRDFRMSA